ncbi:MAG: pantetheine-phosphate adenylyltransferase [Bdellovibrionota bacterium]
MKKKAIYPGSFDPITTGHVDIIERIAPYFDELVVLVAASSQKSPLFTTEERLNLVSKSLLNLPNVTVDSFDGLTVDYMRRSGSQVIVRGLRAVVDFEYEMTMASMNKKLAPEFETMLIFARPEYYYISSRGIKEIAANNGNLDGLVPKAVESELRKKYQRKG